MAAASETIQTIARLTPLADVLASFDLSIRPVAPREEALAKAVGLTLAAVPILMLGTVDDVRGTHPWVKLAIQTCAALVLVQEEDRVLLMVMDAEQVLDMVVAAEKFYCQEFLFMYLVI